MGLLDIGKIKVESNHFVSSDYFELFPEEKNRIALIYGKNGAGKSTIAQGFKNIHSENAEINIFMFDKSSKQIAYAPERDSAHIFVFDEEYINQKIKLSGDGLETVVLLGSQPDIDAAIKNTEKELKIIRSKQEIVKENLEKLEDCTDISSPYYHRKEGVVNLKKEWAKVDKEIRENVTNSRVNDELFLEIGGMEIFEENIDELKLEFETKFRSYQNSACATDAISTKANDIHFKKDEIVAATVLLMEQEIEKPTLTQREQEILQLFNNDMYGLSSVRDYVGDQSRVICDRCLQPITEEHKSTVMEQIKNILNKEYEDFIDKLNVCKLVAVNSNDYLQFKKVDETQYNNVMVAITEINSIIEAHNSEIDKKIGNPFAKIEYTSGKKLLSSYNKLEIELDKLEEQRNIYNSVFDSRETYKTELIELNKKIASNSIQPEWIKYKVQSDKLKAQKKDEEFLKKQENDLEMKRSKQESELKNTKIAMEDINLSLSYIFYSKDRLLIEPGEDGLYRLKVNGKNVKPNKISVGERNAIALCYFFTELTSGKKREEAYSNPMFLVIDDPVSSFDLGNRIGTISLLKLKLEKIFLSNIESKCLVLTHDISVMFNLSKCFEEISNSCKARKCHANFTKFEISNKKLLKFLSSTNDYTRSIRSIYDFSSDPEESDNHTIGNTMRKVLEGFSTFSYRKGHSDLSLNEQILSMISEDKRDYFRALMYRLFLDDESHLLDSAKADTENHFVSYFTLEEKQRTAKDILIFMYLLNKLHVLFQLAENGDFKSISSTIESWIEEIE